MSDEGQNLNSDPGLELSPREKRATEEAAGVKKLAVISATAFLLSVVPVIGKAINVPKVYAMTLLCFPVILIYWLIRHKLVNRVSCTPRDLWLSIAIWIGAIVVKALLTR
jgi:hypothetical protein